MAAVKHTKGVVDLTFLDIEEEEHMTVLIDRLPRSAICKLDLSASLTHQPGSLTHDGSASPSKKRQSETITSIRLGNNNIQNIDIIYKSINAALDTSTILWLDLAFNNITNICGKIAENFPVLETLNLHANNIKSFKEVKKLASVTTLRALSLQGNPITERKHYRNYCLYACPKLHKFDMTIIINEERKKMQVWADTFRKVLNKDEDNYE